MLQKRMMLVVGLIVALSMVLTACGGTAAPTTASTQAPATTEIAATAAPTAVPPATRHGGWLDEIDFSVVTADSAVTQLKAGAIDIYAGGLAANNLQAIKDAGLNYGTSNGLYYDILYNPAVLKDTATLNPFSDRKIREATNWLFDRNYINQEVYAGGSLPKWFSIQTNGPEYADLADVARGLEAKYAYNPDKAKQVIATEMQTLGATLGPDGKWQYKGKPVSIIFLVRNDSDGTRVPIGDYVTKQLASVGFTVDEQYKKSSEASPLWIGSDPADGKWTVYTAAWSSTAISRDEANMFQQMYLKSSQQGTQPFLSNVADPAFQKLGDDLAQNNFNTTDQRRQMMTQALALSLQDSIQVFLIDGKNFAPYSTKVQATSDLAAGIEGSQVGAYTVRFTGKEGGQMKWGEPDLFADPWNPIGGSNWTFDHAAYDMTQSGGTMYDPYTGLLWPLRIDKAEVTVQKNLPVSKTLDWVTLNTADTITVPPDVNIDWDAKAQKFITVGTKFPNGLTAKVKSVVTYPADLFDKVKWQDGSKLDVADFVMGMILTYDRSNKDSAIYDDASVPYFQSFAQQWKGFKIDSTNPLTIEVYTDQYYRDAELNVATLWPGGYSGSYITYSYGEAGWDILSVANLAEAAGELAYTPDKADAKKIEETSFIGGPSLDILTKYLAQADSKSYIPYAPTLGQYITADQAKARYDNLTAWYKAHNHYWVGTGPYYLDKVFLTEKTLTLKTNPDFPDLSDRWSSFGEPKFADATVDGPAQVKIGDTATFDINVTFKGNPYPQAEIKQVKYLLYDATGAVVGTGTANAVADGHYQVVLGTDVTSKLTAGSDKIEVAVIPLPVSVPTFTSLDFVTVP
jgi:peptide/nickel transport system substrate-binding protein